MEQAIARLRALATDALKQYQEEVRNGGEPQFPAWTADLLSVCAVAERVERTV